MKQFFVLSAMIGLFVAMLCFPQATFDGASNGLLLWFQIILPTLLPFMIFSNLLVRTNAIDYIAYALKSCIQPVFQVSPPSCYAIVAGFLCGYPMGAKVIADLTRSNRISHSEGQYLLSFCNNSSPMFILSYIVLQNFKNDALSFGTLFILISTPILCSFIFRRHYLKQMHRTNTYSSSRNRFVFHFEILDDSIMNSFEMITKIGGYIIIFSILFRLAETMPYNWYLPLLEISNGIPWILHQGLSFNSSYILVIALTSFGGICAMLQTHSMLQGTNIRMLPYIIQKLITTLVTSLLAFIYVIFILQ